MPNDARLSIASSVLRRRDEVVRDLRRMHLEPEAHALRVEDVDDRPPPLGELLIAAVDLGVVVGRERIDEMPDRGAGEAVHDRHTELCGGAGGVLHPLGGAGAHALGVAVPVHVGRQDRAVPGIDPVADRLADEMRTDRPDAEPVALEQLAPALGVRRVGDRLLDLEVIAPAGQLEPVEAPAGATGRELVDRQIGPLTGEESDGTRHSCLLARAWDGKREALRPAL